MQSQFRRPGWFWLGLSALIGLSAALCILGAARAQSSARASLSGLSAKNFPGVSASLVVFDANNNFVKDLQPENVQILEGNQRVSPTSILYNHPGVQFVTAISLGPAMAMRDAQGIARFDYLKSEILEQAGALAAAGGDDLSLVVAGGPELTHSAAQQDWIDALANFAPENLRSATPDLEVLGRALALVNDPTPRPGMGRIVLFITPPQPVSAAPGLSSLAQSARQQGVRIFVWMVSSYADSVAVEAGPLHQLAEQTGGAFLNFDQPAPLPALNDYLEPLRSIYTLNYSTTLRANGIYTISAAVQLDGAVIQSNALDFEVNLQPPNPIFVGLPVRIERWTRPITTTGTLAKPTQIAYKPLDHAIEIHVDFPDGHARSLTKSTLYVNGQASQVNNVPPFNHFSWDLSGYTQDATYILRVEVVDTLGLTGSSLEMPVDIHIDVPKPTSPFAAITPQLILLILLGALVLGALIGLVLLLAGRLQPSQLGQSRRWRRPAQRASPRSAAATLPLADAPAPFPATRPLSPQRRLPTWISRLQRNPTQPGDQAASQQPVAYLTPVGEDGEPGTPIPIQNIETTFGRDGELASWTLDNPSLEGLHARLRREGNAFRLLDEGTTAGTWINYCEVPPGGAQVQHGDLVHIGQIGFRFTLRDVRHPRKPVITLYTGPNRSGSHETH